MIDDYFDTPLEHNGRPARISNYTTDALTAAVRFVESNGIQTPCLQRSPARMVLA